MALAPLSAQASPMVERLNGSQAILTLDPDPPTIGKVHATVDVLGVPAASLKGVTVRFSSTMPSMAMEGPAGVAQPVRLGRYTFTTSLPMAAPWTLRLQFSGGAVRGMATYKFAVVGPGDAAMAGMSSGDVTAWRTAVFGLFAIILVGAFVLRGDRRPATFGVFVSATVLVLIMALLQNRYAAPAMDMSSMSTMRGSGPMPVTLVTVRSGATGTDVFAPGTIQPYLTQDIVTRAPGILRDFDLYAGDRLRAGQTIANLDAPELGSQAQAANADAQAQAASARAAAIEAHHHAPVGLSIAQNEAASTRTDLSAAIADERAKNEQRDYWNNEISREQKLFSQGAVSQQELQDERAQAAAANSAYQGAVQHVASLQQQVEAAQSRTMDARATIAMALQQAESAQSQALKASSSAQAAGTLAGYRTVVSPDDAVVLKRLVDPGVYVQAGTPILRIAVVNRLRIQANVAQEDLDGIAVGTPMMARLSNGKILRGRVSSVAPAADPTTHTAQVEAIVPGTAAGIPPGGYVRVTLHRRAAMPMGELKLPSAAVVGGGSDAAVWVDDDGTAHRVAVRVLSDDGITAFLKGDLRHNARVVTDGADTLEEGQAIAEQHS
ncbi:MAG: efflux RND transporter periplasmic adaptor subunit [Candidatus Eremiobacteraeota bacterium]|nr:efflux RND transporter periplasmic adaptor subunit [Candidatus Eremiobacteraeota bacterium]MBC5828173.1 efflux RND transporter periplasmic adaptor subunit [Candidatus Eremiobacteraeota bacterium]